ncbi:hypothetical protein FACS1894189_2380 [Planctomycetales bacterium]|nr:hypothetical protein FACS1894189_2380 [Planctomycetales bacterium]
MKKSVIKKFFDGAVYVLLSPFLVLSILPCAKKKYTYSHIVSDDFIEKHPDYLQKTREHLYDNPPYCYPGETVEFWKNHWFAVFVSFLFLMIGCAGGTVFRFWWW